MKPSLVRDQFSQVERSLSHAALACEAIPDIPSEMRRAIAERQRECQSMCDMLESDYDPDRVRVRLDALEAAVLQLAQTCRRDAIDGQVGIAIEHAHAVLADLKHKLA